MTQDGIDRGPKAHDSAAQVERFDREGQNPVIL
jgi:hypothetical protein